MVFAIVDNGFSRIIPADCCPQTQYNFYNYDSGNTQCPGLCGTQHAPSGGKLLNSLPPWIAQHTKTAYYLCSCVTMLIMMGVAGMMLLACMDKDDRRRQAGWSSLFCCCFCGNGCRDWPKRNSEIRVLPVVWNPGAQTVITSIVVVAKEHW